MSSPFPPLARRPPLPLVALPHYVRRLDCSDSVAPRSALDTAGEATWTARRFPRLYKEFAAAACCPVGFSSPA